MAADVFFAKRLVEARMLEHTLYIGIYSRQYNLYAFLTTHLAEIGEIVDACGVNKRHLAHPNNTHLGTVAKGSHDLLKLIASTKEIRTIDLIHLYTLGHGEMLEIATHICVFIWVDFIHHNLHIGGFGHAAHEEQTCNDQSHFDGYGKVEEDSEQEGNDQYGDIEIERASCRERV